MKGRGALWKQRLPEILASGTLLLSALESLFLEPHTASLMADYGLPAIAFTALVLGIAALIRKRWRRLAALAAVILLCAACGVWLTELTACNCEEVMYGVFNRG